MTRRSLFSALAALLFAQEPSQHLLSGLHSDTTTAGPAKGDLVYGGYLVPRELEPHFLPRR